MARFILPTSLGINEPCMPQLLRRRQSTNHALLKVFVVQVNLKQIEEAMNEDQEMSRMKNVVHHCSGKGLFSLFSNEK